MEENNLTSTNPDDYINYYASGIGVNTSISTSTYTNQPYLKYNKNNGMMYIANGKEEIEVSVNDSQDSIVDKVITRLMEEGMANVLFDSIISKLSEYLDSEDNKELLKDLLDFKVNLVKESLNKELSTIKSEIGQIRVDIEHIRVALGLNGNYNDKYYLGNISNRLNKLETTSNKVEGLWENYIGKIDSLITKDNNSNIS